MGRAFPKGTKLTGGTHATKVFSPEHGKEVSLYQLNRVSVAGRPRIWKTPEELEKAMDDYFTYCEEDGKPATITKMALYLGVDRHTLWDYPHRDEFSPLFKKAKLKCLAFAEDKLFSGTPVGSMFYLKNNYRDLYKDDKHVEVTQNININEIMGVWDKKNVIDGQIVESPENTVPPQLPEENSLI